MKSPRFRDSLEGLARVLILSVLFVVFGVIVPGGAFFSAGNIENILTQSAVYSMAGLGMTMIIIAGGIDLAAGSIIALSMVVTAMSLKSVEVHTPLTLLLSMLAGVAASSFAGLLQGSLITGLRVVPFIVTLGGLVSIRGFTKAIAENQEISPPPNWLYYNLMYPVQGRSFSWLLFPLGVWVMLIAAVLASAVLNYTRFGRRVYAIGSNEATARLCGVRDIVKSCGRHHHHLKRLV
jgi:ribose/xylose/arabinose/galactoside ABC-type transport system permease subunit